MTLKQIKDAIIEDLKGITTREGFNTDVKDVRPVFLSYQDINEYPAICVSLIMGGNKMLPSGVIEHQNKFAIVGYMQSDNDLDKSGLLEDNLVLLYEDINEILFNQTNNLQTKVSEFEIGDYLIEAEGNVGMISTILTTKNYI